MIHEDERRKLEDFAEGKILTIKEDSIVGRHFHRVKTEIFYLVSGSGTISIDGFKSNIEPSRPYKIYPFVKHEFELKKGSVLLGFCSHPYDPEDDIKY